MPFETDTDYYLLAVADPDNHLSETDETNDTAVFSGVYHPVGGEVFAHGTETGDTVTMTPGSTKVNFNGTIYTYTDATGLRIRTHGGNDIVNGSAIALPMSIWGGDGDDTLTAGSGNDRLEGGAGDDTLKGNAGSDTLLGGAGSDTLIGRNSTSTWTITGADEGTVGTTGFSSFENLTGGTGGDTFKLTTAASGVAGQINGGSGTDTLVAFHPDNTWNLSGTAAGNLNGSLAFVSIENLTGGTGSDVFRFTDAATGFGTLNGGGGADTLDYQLVTATSITVNLQTGAATKMTKFLSMESLIGGAMTDTLVGPNTTNTWNLMGSKEGNLNSGAFRFSQVENLTGVSGTDLFRFDDAAAGFGTISGGSGTDKLDYSLVTGPITVSIASGTAPKLTKFTYIESFDGTAAAGDTLIGRNSTSTWTLTAPGAGTLGPGTFSSFENLTGGSSTDRFKFTDGADFNTVNGGSGTDTFDYSAVTGPITVNLQERTAPKVTNPYTAIESFIGTAASDTLIGPNATITWTLNSETGTALSTAGSTKFKAFENLNGGTGADIFKFSDSSVTIAMIDGGEGTDTLSYASVTTPVQIDLATRTAPKLTDGFERIESFIGGTASDTLIGTDADTTWTVSAANGGTAAWTESRTFSSFENLTGGSGTDTFKISGAGSVAGLLDGGSDDGAILDYGLLTGGIGVTVDLQAGTATRTGGVANIRIVIGSPYADTLTGNDSGVVLLGGAGADTLNGGGGRDLLIGGSGTDTLHGGDEQDILYGGTTTYYSESTKSLNLTAINAIMAEWSRTDLGDSSDLTGYLARIDHLRGVVLGGLHDPYFLKSSTLTNDSAADHLWGDGDLDWFLCRTEDVPKDPEPTEEVITWL